MRSLGPDEVPATNGEGSPRATTWRWLFVTWVAFSIGLVQAFVLRGDSVTTDENSYLFQAHVFSHARLWAPLPPEGRLLDFDFSMINFTDDRWFSRYFFGHPLALVPGVVAGYPLLIPLVMGLASVLLIRALGRRCYTDGTANAAMLLLRLSPFFLAMHATLLSHTTCMLALLSLHAGVCERPRTAAAPLGAPGRCLPRVCRQHASVDDRPDRLAVPGVAGLVVVEVSVAGAASSTARPRTLGRGLSRRVLRLQLVTDRILVADALHLSTTPRSGWASSMCA